MTAHRFSRNVTPYTRPFGRAQLFVSVTYSVLAVSQAPAQEPFHTAAIPAPRPGTIFLFPERIPLEGGGLVWLSRCLGGGDRRRLRVRRSVLDVPAHGKVGSPAGFNRVASRRVGRATGSGKGGRSR